MKKETTRDVFDEPGNKAMELVSLNKYKFLHYNTVYGRQPAGCYIIESVDSICRDSADTQYMLIQTNVSKSPK